MAVFPIITSTKLYRTQVTDYEFMSEQSGRTGVLFGVEAIGVSKDEKRAWILHETAINEWGDAMAIMYKLALLRTN